MIRIHPRPNNWPLGKTIHSFHMWLLIEMRLEISYLSGRKLQRLYREFFKEKNK